MKPARILLLVIALVAGGLAAWLATQGGNDAPVQQAQAPQVVEEAKVQIVVAKTAIGMAERLNALNIEWIDWPESSLRDEYVTAANNPNAITELAGAVARFEFFPGEPIRQDKLVHTDQGYLSAVLAKGMRGVSIPVSSASASGGFIVPNDRVDVILTQASQAGQISQVILGNVRVLAIGQRLGEKGATGAPADPENPRAEIFSDSTIATLELDPGQAETLINATSLGRLSLTLRSVADFNEAADANRKSSNQPIKVIRYGNEAAVLSGATSTASAQPQQVDPAEFMPAVVSPSPMLDGSEGALPVSNPTPPPAQ